MGQRGQVVGIIGVALPGDGSKPAGTSLETRSSLGQVQVRVVSWPAEENPLLRAVGMQGADRLPARVV